MKLSRANYVNCGAVLLALLLFTGSILIGDRRTIAAAPTPDPTSVAAAAQEAETSDGSPQVESVSASPRGPDDVFAADGNARLLVRFMPEERVPQQIKTVIDDRDVLLRDDGAGGDEVAGDGAFSAIVTIDFNALADNQDEIQLVNSQPEPQPTVAEEEPPIEPSVDGAEQAETQDGPSASAAATVGTVTEEEAADTDLRSDTLVVMPDFDDGRDFPGNKSAPLVDFRNLRPGQIVPLWRIGTYRRVDPARSLVITNVRVVEDPTRTFNPCTNIGNPNGPWTFKTLMTAMANQPVTGINPSTFVRRWLDKWMADQVVNGFTVLKRQQMQTLVIDPWVAASGGPHNETPLLTSFVNLNTPLILIEKHNVPNTFMGVNFLGGSSLAPRDPNLPVDDDTNWDNPPGGPFITNRQARHKFSLNTCNSCHKGETNTVFTHIKPVTFGTEAGLSGFMNGIDPNTGTRPFKVVDPADGTPTRKFNEFRRRALDLDKLVHSPCFFDIHRRGIPPIH